MMIRQDLANHAVYGAALYLVGSIFNPWLGLAIAVGAAFGKDYIWDKKLGKGTFDPKDILATVVLPIGFFLKDNWAWIQSLVAAS